MASYNPSSDKIEVLGGRIIRPQRAEQLKKSIDKQLELRQNYINSPLYDEDIAVNLRAVNILCSDYEPSEDIFVTIGFVFENESVECIPEKYVVGWVDKWDTHGDILVKESDVESVFKETNATFTGFQVRFAEHDVVKEFRE